MFKQKQILFLPLIFSIAVFIQGCSKKTEELIIQEMAIEKSAIALAPSASLSINITSGNGGYTATSSNDNVARATIADNVITITATSKEDKAHAVIVVTDKYYQRKTIDVDVAKLLDLSLSATEATLEVGVTGKNELVVNINSGNAGYKVEAIENTASFVDIDKSKLESHGKFIVKGIAAGTAKLKVTDAKAKEAMLTFTVTAPSTLTLSTNTVNLEAVQGAQEVTVSSGNGDYKATVANPLIARAFVKGDVVTIRGKVNGSTSVVVEDKKGQQSTINVTVNGAEYAMNFSDQYFGYANFSDIGVVDASVRNLKQVTFEMTCRINGYRGLQTFMGLEGNLIIRGKNDDFRPTHPIQIAGLGDRITLETTKSFNLNEWMNIALVVDCDQTEVQNKYKFYINGVQDVLVVARQEQTHTTVNLASSSDGNRFAIGRAFGQDFRALRGSISEARVWTVARTEQQIKDNMCNLTAGAHVGLLTRWNFSAGAETGYIQDSNGGKYETNLILANAKLNNNYTQVKVPASVFVSKGCPN